VTVGLSVGEGEAVEVAVGGINVLVGDSAVLKAFGKGVSMGSTGVEV
jgi:hypothetical protein